MHIVRQEREVTAPEGEERFLWEQFELSCTGEGFGAVLCAELAVDVARMRLDRAYGDEEIPGDLGVGSARGE